MAGSDNQGGQKSPVTKPAAAAPSQFPNRAELDAALAALPGDHHDAGYVLTAMRVRFGELFTTADEMRVREVVKPRAPEVEVTEPVKMTRDPDLYPAPHTADVHPDEVKTWQRSGWVVESDGAH